MKIYMVCGVFCAIGFFAMAMQLGLFGEQRSVEANPEAPPPVEKKAKAPRAKFPQELAPAAQARAVPIAAAFEPSDGPHKLTFLKATGELHPFQETLDKYDDEWCARWVEDTELVVVVGNSRRTEVQLIRYPNGAPPVSRYRYDLEASIVEAKTGTVLANQHFSNVPRLIRPVESWELAAIGAPVSYRTVFRWASGIAKTGRPQVEVAGPIITTIE